MIFVGQEELPGYLQYPLELAGTQAELFEQHALDTIFQAASGLPRKVNLLAHFSLNFVALKQTSTLSTEHILMAVKEMGKIRI